MLSPFDIRFFTTLADVAAGVLGPGHDCTEAAQVAARSGDPQDSLAARTCLDHLPADQRDRLMAETHRRLATDLSAIWDQLPGAPPGSRIN